MGRIVEAIDLWIQYRKGAHSTPEGFIYRTPSAKIWTFPQTRGDIKSGQSFHKWFESNQWPTSLWTVSTRLFVYTIPKGGFLSRIRSGTHWVLPHLLAKTEWGHPRHRSGWYLETVYGTSYCSSHTTILESEKFSRTNPEKNVFFTWVLPVILEGKKTGLKKSSSSNHHIQKQVVTTDIYCDRQDWHNN